LRHFRRLYGKQFHFPPQQVRHPLGDEQCPFSKQSCLSQFSRSRVETRQRIELEQTKDAGRLGAFFLPDLGYRGDKVQCLNGEEDRRIAVLLVQGLDGLAQLLLLVSGQEGCRNLPELGFHLSAGVEKRTR
jgi:hypothetical protein